jgi:large subunit ribosomal protein L10
LGAVFIGHIQGSEMNKEQKAEVVEQIAAQIEGSEAIYAVDYRGLTVTKAAELRSNLREASTSFRVVKNTLTVRAADKAGAESLRSLVEEGPTALAFVSGDPALAAKALDTFARQSQMIELKGGVLAGRALDIEELRGLARLPGRDQLNAQLAGIVASPITGLVRGLGALLSGLAIALGQVQDQRAGEAPPEAKAPPEAEPEAEAPATGEPQSDSDPVPSGESEAEPEAESAAQAAAESVSEEQQQQEPEPEKEAE